MRKATAILELEPYLDRKPGQLSGGQRQRVAMGRAIVRQPKAFLMDEPLSNLDAKLRVQMRAEIARLQRDLAVTTIYVTHDQVEAMTMGDRVAVLRDGHLEQVDTPQNLYDLPANVFVGRLHRVTVDEPLRRHADARGDAGSVQIGSQTVAIPTETFTTRPALRAYDGKHVVVGIRPEDFEDATVEPGAPADRRITATVKLVEALGSELVVHMAIDAKRVDSGDPDAPEELLGEGIANAIARFSPHSRVAVDEDVEIVVAVESMHFFDADNPPGHLELNPWGVAPNPPFGTVRRRILRRPPSQHTPATNGLWHAESSGNGDHQRRPDLSAVSSWSLRACGARRSVPPSGTLAPPTGLHATRCWDRPASSRPAHNPVAATGD